MHREMIRPASHRAMDWADMRLDARLFWRGHELRSMPAKSTMLAGFTQRNSNGLFLRATAMDKLANVRANCLL